MTESDPAYSTNGETLSRATVEAIRLALAQRSDGVSIVVNAERLLEALGVPVESAVRLRVERRRALKHNR